MTISYLKNYFGRAANSLHLDNLPSDAISTDKIKVFMAHIGLDPTSPWYGRIIGYFTKDERFYRFIYNVHRPKQGSPNLSNKMTDLSEIIEMNGLVCSDIGVSEDWCPAFWSDYKMSELKKKNLENAVALRELMAKITAYSRENKLCEKLRRTDKLALQLNPAMRALT